MAPANRFGVRTQGQSRPELKPAEKTPMRGDRARAPDGGSGVLPKALITISRRSTLTCRRPKPQSALINEEKDRAIDPARGADVATFSRDAVDTPK